MIQLVVEVQSHGNRGCQGSDDERDGNNEPGHRTQLHLAEDVENVDGGTSKEDLAGNHPQTKVSGVESDSDRKKQGIEQRRGAEVVQKTHLRVLLFRQKKMLDIGKIMSLTGRSEEDVIAAIKAVATDDMIDVVAHLLDPPPNPGAKYIPPKPVIDDGLTPEVREKLKTARELSDFLNKRATPTPVAAGASRQSGPKIPLAALVEEQRAAVEEDERTVAVSVPSLSQLLTDTREQTS